MTEDQETEVLLLLRCMELYLREINERERRFEEGSRPVDQRLHEHLASMTTEPKE